MVESPPAPTPAPEPIPRPRNHDPYRQYIRQRSVRAFEARPYKGGVRHYLGRYRTYHDARRAVVKFFAGTLKPLPKWVRVATPEGEPATSGELSSGFIANVPVIQLVRPFRSCLFDDPQAAGVAAAAHLAAETAKLAKIVGPEAAAKLMAAFLKRG